MRNYILKNKIGSLNYGGKTIDFIPEKMENVGNLYFTEIDGVRFEYTLEFPEDNSFYSSLRITNLSNENSKQIINVNSLDLTLSKYGTAVLETLSGDGCTSKNFIEQRAVLADGTDYFASPTGGRSSNLTAFPYFDITDDKNTYVFGVGWSGQWKMNVDTNENSFRVKFGLCRCNLFLTPGETALFPSAVCKKGVGLTSVRNEFKELIRKNYSPQANVEGDILRPICLSVGDCFKDEKNSYENMLKEVDLAAKAGFDVAWADAIWFKGKWDKGVGNYIFKDFLTEGLKPVFDSAHEKGLKTVMWFEIERAFPYTEMYNEHGNFLMPHSVLLDFKLVDLGNDGCRQFLFEKLSEMIETQGIDILRIDCNIDPILYWDYADSPDRVGIKEIHYIDGLYKLWDALLERFPHLSLDNCASGGRRLDFELLKRSVNYCRSDYTNEHIRAEKARFAAIQSRNLNKYVPYTSPIIGGEPSVYAARVGFTGAICFSTSFVEENQTEQTKKIIEECKRVRPLWNKDFYPLTEQYDFWTVYQIDRDDKGAVYYLRHDGAENDSKTVTLEAIDQKADYKVVITDEQMQKTEKILSGAELKEKLCIKIDATRQSALVEYEKI